MHVKYKYKVYDWWNISAMLKYTKFSFSFVDYVVVEAKLMLLPCVFCKLSYEYTRN